MTIDDVTGKPRSVVEISVVNGLAQGTIIKMFPRNGDIGLCGHCSGDLKGKPIVGLRILSGVKRDGDQWDGGSILDPGDGQSYEVRLRVLDGGEAPRGAGISRHLASWKNANLGPSELGRLARYARPSPRGHCA